MIKGVHTLRRNSLKDSGKKKKTEKQIKKKAGVDLKESENPDGMISEYGSDFSFTRQCHTKSTLV